MKQEVTRSHKGWALDSVITQNLVTKYSKDDVDKPPPEGVYIYVWTTYHLPITKTFNAQGLFLEGASLDRKTGKLVESRAKVLYEQMPVIYIYAINTTGGKDNKLYESPIYRKPGRKEVRLHPFLSFFIFIKTATIDFQLCNPKTYHHLPGQLYWLH